MRQLQGKRIQDSQKECGTWCKEDKLTFEADNQTGDFQLVHYSPSRKEFRYIRCH